MNWEEKNAAIRQFAETAPEYFWDCVSVCDGHTLYYAKTFLDRGMPDDLAVGLLEVHESDGSPKGSITNADGYVDRIEAIYGLSFLRDAASALDVDYEPALGRGSEARNIKEALRVWVNEAINQHCAELSKET